MSCTARLRWFLCIAVLLTATGVGCSRDPNVRKQKFFEQGNRDFEQGKYPEALIFYGRALRIDPRFPEAHYRMARCHLKLGSWAGAYQELQRTIELQPENWSAQLDVRQLVFAAGKIQDAKDRALLILRDPTSIAPFMTLGDFYQQQKRWAGAEHEFESAISLAPKDPMPRAALAGLYVSSDNSTYLYHLGLTYQKLNDSARDRAEVEKAIRLGPKSPIAEEARRALGQMTGT